MYIYIINYTYDEKELCLMEMKYLFGITPLNKYFYSEKQIDVDRSPFIKIALDVKEEADSLEELVYLIKKNKLSYENFKVKYINNIGNIAFEKRHEIENEVGFLINGNANIHNPEIMIGVTQVDYKWILGEYKKCSGLWKFHNQKPVHYCNALTTKLSRSVVNIAAAGLQSPRIVDPCCGVGTILVEALSMGFNIKGFDINSEVVIGTRKNLLHFGFDNVVEVCDINKLDEQFDVSIIDIPYGILSVTTKSEQIEILKNARRISNRLLLISIEKMDYELYNLGFNIFDHCIAAKGRFKRYITLCK